MQKNNFFIGLIIIIVSALFLVFLVLMFSDSSDNLIAKSKKGKVEQRSIRELTLLRQASGKYKLQGFFVKEGTSYCNYNKDDTGRAECSARFVILSERSGMGDPVGQPERDDDIVIDGNIEGDFLVDSKYEFQVELIRYNGINPVVHYLSHKELPVDMTDAVCGLSCSDYTDLDCPEGCVTACEYRLDKEDDKSACVIGDCRCPNDDYFDDNDQKIDGNISLACKAFPGEPKDCILEKNKLCDDSGGRKYWKTIDNKKYDMCNCGEDFWNFEEGCGRRCVEGNCTDDSKRCHDSDNNSSTVVGTVDYLGKTYQDHCYDADYAVEYGCNNDEKFENSYKCSAGCHDGQCVVTSTDKRNCRDVDGIDYFRKSVTSLRAQNDIRSDECSGDNTVIEYFCKSEDATEISKQKYACTLGCENGACRSVRESCSDSDGGRDIYKKGKVESFTSGNKTWKTDECFAANRVLEYYCEGTKVQHKIMYCMMGCEEGACLAETLE